MPFTLHGQLAMQGVLKKVASRMKVRAKESLLAHGEEILENAQAITPEDTGALVNSGEVKVTGDLKVQISFGDAATAAYVLAVHEHPSEHDPPSWVGKDVHFTKGGPQFLVQPMLDAIQTLPKDLADDLHLEHLL
jgi:hypothetical protein